MNYSLASNSWDTAEHDAINRVIASQMLTMGKEVRSFESRIADFHNVKHAIMVNSGSSANLIGATAMSFVRSQDIRPTASRGTVIAPAVSWSTTYFPFIQLGYQLRLVDVDDDYNIDVTEVEKYLDESCVGVISVNLLGVSADNVRLKTLCEKHNLFLFEDNCESFGASYEGSMCGSFGDAGTLSFFFSHHLQTMEGGMVLTDCDNIANYARSLRAHGWVRDGEYSDLMTGVESDEFDSLFKFVLPGYCVRPLEMSGAVGNCQLDKWPSQRQHRRDNAEVFFDLAESRSYMSVQKSKGEPTWFGFGCIFDLDRAGRLDLFRFLKARQIDSRPIVVGNFARQPVSLSLELEVCGRLTIADKINDSGMFFGNDGIDLTDQINYLFASLDSYFGR